ncbi:MAG: hypothetical protein GF331_20540 [Chitinivibrionales bacterium]|nr:hypothetical protein [Chitinivibrionales bacterium]
MKHLGCCIQLLLVLSILPATAAKAPVSIAVNELLAEGLPASEARIISDRIRTELLNTGSFRVMERAEMERILKEQGFQKTGACSDESCVLEVGQLLGVRQMLTGSIGKIGDLYTINTRMIDIRTGEILYSANVDCRCKVSDVLQQSTRQVAQLIAQKSSGRQPSPDADSESSDDTTKKPLLRRAGFWVPVASAVVVGGGIAAYLLLAGDDDESTDEQLTPTSGGVEFTW